MYIKLTEVSSGNDLYVNKEKIEAIQDFAVRSTLVVGGCKYNVTETPEEILKLIENRVILNE